MITFPKVFICHASDDKGRFVLEFANKLWANGVNAWMDLWEISLGDSLVDRIFDEGLRNADACIVVVSQSSVTKPWVRKELNTAVVKSIESDFRLIPVVLDDCEVPEALKSLYWIRIKDINNYDSELSKIVSSIFGNTDRPELGIAPKYTEASIVDYLPELTRFDNLTFAVLCGQYFKIDSQYFDPADSIQELKAADLTFEDICESLEILEGRGYIEIERALGGRILSIRLAPSTADVFLRNGLDDYDRIVKTIISQIVNEGIYRSSDLHERTSYPLAVVIHMLELFESQGLVKLSEMISVIREVVHVSPELKRMLG